MSGLIQRFYREENRLLIKFETGVGIVEVIAPSIIRIAVPKQQSDGISAAIENLERVSCPWRVEQIDGKLHMETEALKIQISDDFKVDIFNANNELICADYRGERESFSRRGEGDIAGAEGHQINKMIGSLQIEVIKQMDGDEFFYGFGDKTGHLNKKGYHYKTWNTDDPRPQVESYEALYKAVPFFITLKNRHAYGIFFDNTFETHFDMGKENEKYYYFGADQGALNYYFIDGPSVQAVMRRYTSLTGTTPLPQMWTLGYQQCRWSYTPEERLLEVAKTFREKEIPCDGLYLDIDYMDQYKVFTWNEERFAEPKRTTEKLAADGFKLVTIIDPGVKKEKGYSIYDQGIKNGYFAKDKDGIPYVNTVWPGESLFPDFAQTKVRSWWAENQKIMMDTGVSGIWNDMNEPSSFTGPLPNDVQFDFDGKSVSHQEFHNLYGHYMSKATYEGIKKHIDKRPFVITRACYAGTQKYSTVWTGDNQSFWESLRASLPMQMNLGLSGFSFCGTDVGGFGFDCTPELLSRWVQVGCFSPLFRNHSSIHTRDQEPWAFNRQTEDINRKYIQLRYRLIPYFYDQMWKGEKSGLPVMAPLFLYAQSDKNTYELNDHFMCGEQILVSPVVQQGQRAKAVYLPEGKWFDYWTKEEVDGGKYLVKETPLETCPIYVKAGSMIPNYPIQNYIGEKKIDVLRLDTYPGDGIYLHYQDDGESFDYQKGCYNTYAFSMEKTDQLTIEVKRVERGYKESYRQFEFVIHQTNAQVVRVNEVEIPFENHGNEVRISVNAEDVKIQIVELDR